MGFVIEWEGQPGGALYISGDTVYIDDLEEIGKRFDIGAAILHMGAAKIPAAGDNPLTMTTAEGIKLAQSLDAKDIFPAHFEGWLHYTEGRDTIEAAFAASPLGDRVHMLMPGESAEIGMGMELEA